MHTPKTDRTGEQKRRFSPKAEMASAPKLCNWQIRSAPRKFSSFVLNSRLPLKCGPLTWLYNPNK